MLKRALGEYLHYVYITVKTVVGGNEGVVFKSKILAWTWMPDEYEDTEIMRTTVKNVKLGVKKY